MFSSHRNLNQKEGNPIKGTTVEVIETKEQFKVISPLFNFKLEVSGYRLQLASSVFAPTKDVGLDNFWQHFKIVRR
jgi:hypothetical protein